MLYCSRRLDSWHSSVSFDGCGEGASFAADECAGSFYDMYIEVEISAQDVLPQKADLAGLFDGHGSLSTARGYSALT